MWKHIVRNSLLGGFIFGLIFFGFAFIFWGWMGFVVGWEFAFWELVVFGVLVMIVYSGVLLTFSWRQWCNLQRILGEIQSKETVIHYGFANHMLYGKAIGGFLFALGGALYFCPHKYNFASHDMRWNYESIKEMRQGDRYNRIEIRLDGGDTETLVVHDRSEWMDVIERGMLSG